MTLTSLLISIAALVFVLGLIALTAFALKRYGSRWTQLGNTNAADLKRLSITAIKPIDNRHKLVLIRRDNKEHLLLVGADESLVIEQDINGGE